ncbi:MAG: ParB/RepB/Spo0J family partition protein [Anaerolineales bacterium]|jgi:ParB family chromosome partitioning protein
MPSKKLGLGRGLEALLPAEQAREGVVQVAPSRLHRNPRQPRTALKSAELEELTASVRLHGVLQPLIVSPGPLPGEYTLVAGERRLEAARRAGLVTVPVVVREVSDREQLELALIENAQREDLAPLEMAEAYRQLSEEFGLSHEEIATRVSKSRVSVTNTLRLLRLPASVRQALTDGRLSEGHARALLSLPSAHAQAAAADSVIRRGLNVRQTEELVRKLLGQRPVRPAPQRLAADLRALVKRLQETLGTRVTLRHSKRGGTLVLHYYSDEELDALARRLLGKE